MKNLPVAILFLLIGTQPSWAGVTSQLQDLRQEYPELSTSEVQRQKFILALVDLRQKLVAAGSRDWQVVDGEIMRHPAPPDSRDFREAIVGTWTSGRDQYRYFRNGTWITVDFINQVPGTWSVTGNHVEMNWVNPPLRVRYTIILLKHGHLISTDGSNIYIEEPVTDSPK